jgi:hypothetical protein
MRSIFGFFLVAAACYHCSAKELLLPACNRGYILPDSLPGKARGNFQGSPAITAPFQGKKLFCSTDSKATYEVIIKGNRVVIAMDSTRITGLFKGDKLFTNDPSEIEYRHFSHAYFGKYYVIGTDYFSVLNPENGEYSYFMLCK